MNSLKKGIAALLLAGAGAAQAAPQIFFGEDQNSSEAAPLAAYPNASDAQAAFLSSLAKSATASFEAIPTYTEAPLAVSFGALGTATLSGDGMIQTVAPGSIDNDGRYATSGSNFWEVTGGFTITFSAPVVAFGFYGVDIGDFNGQITLALTTAKGVTQLTVPNGINISGGGVLYYGVIDPDNPFTSITFGNTASGFDYFGFDDFTIGVAQQTVPAPMTLALLGIGLAGLGLSRRTRRA